jgi:hypothetical protein
MPRYLIVQCELREGGEPIVFVVNHWGSRKGGEEAARERSATARRLADWIAEPRDETCVLVVGDFNAEPFEVPFDDLHLRAIRQFSPALWRGPAPGCLYNTAWRFLAEHDPWEEVEKAGPAYVAPRPMTTYSAPQPVVLDQLLVSGRALRGGPITLLERSVSYHATGTTAATEDGHPRPVPWTYAPGRSAGASDHFPLVATFRMNTGKSDG